MILPNIFTYSLESVLTTTLSVYITESVISCVVSESDCSPVTILCEPEDGEELEWLNPNNFVINSTEEDRIHSKNSKIFHIFT